MQRAGISVSDALVLPTDEFLHFRISGVVDNNLIDRILAQCAIGQFACANQVYIRATSALPYIGLKDKQIAQKNFASIRYAIERVYRSWSDDTALASRTTNHISGEDSFPSLLIEPYIDAVSTLVTRNGVTGYATDVSNYKKNINNKCVFFDETHRKMLAEVDTVLKKPTMVSFLDGTKPLIISLSPQPITARAYQSCLNEYAARGILTPIEYLRRIDPKTVGTLTEYDFVAKNVLLTVDGRSMSPGSAYGQIVFDVSKITNVLKRPILVTRDLPRRDIRNIANCAGIMGLSASVLSHIGVACREFGIPGLSIEDAHIDRNTHNIVFKGGYNIPEYTYGLINYEKKVARFASDAELEPVYGTPSSAEYLDTIKQNITFYEDIQVFRKLSERDQIHLADIRRRLRLIGLM